MRSCKVLIVIFALILHTYSAITIVDPHAGESVDLTKPYTIRWNSTNSDVSSISIDIVNKTVVPGISTLDNLAHYIPTESGEVQIQWPASISNETESYQLIFIDTPTGAPFGQSGVFNLTIPLGESRNASLGTTGAVGPHTPPTSGLSGGPIAGIVVGILVAVSILLAGLWIFLRRRHQRKLQNASDRETKNELDGATTTKPRTELASNDHRRCSNPSAELDGKKQKDSFFFELPSTPPRSPAEMPATEIPAAEMSAGRPASSYFSARNPHGPLSDTSETTDSTLVPEHGTQLHMISRKPVPTSQSIVEERVSVSTNEGERQSLRRPMSETVSLRSARTREGRSPFAVALYDLVSQELRRPDT